MSPDNKANLFTSEINVLVPLAALVFLRLKTRFPIAMAGLLFIFGPLIGCLTLLTVLGLGVKSSYASPALLLWIVFPLSLIFYGLWVTDCGVLGWWWFGQSKLFRNLHPLRRIIAIAGAGVPIGFVLSFVFLAVNSLNPVWPKDVHFNAVLADHIGFMSFAFSGAAAGLVCGLIVALFLDAQLREAEF